MAKRNYINLKINITNDCTPEPSAKRLKRLGSHVPSPDAPSPDEGCFSASREEASRSRRTTSVPFDKDVDSILCLQDRGDEGYFSLSFEAQDAAQSSEELKLGPPLFESSVCGEDDGNSTWESTLPLQVQVKSVVVPVARGPPVEGPRRPQIDREEEKKRKYISAVSRHMRERPQTQDAMGELLCLMTEVAQDSRDRQWQHPSDLTRKNYVKRFKPAEVTWKEYEDQLDFSYKRFATVPDIFKRSK